MKCFLCSQIKPIVFSQYFEEKKGRLNLCFDCLNKLGFKKTQSALLPKLKICPRCQNKFVPKSSWALTCAGCWQKNKK